MRVPFVLDAVGSGEVVNSRKSWIEYYKSGAVEKNLRLSESFKPGRLPMEYQRYAFKRMCDEVESRLLYQERVRIWSAGSGIDTVSLHLKARFGDSVELVLQDISEECVKANEIMYQDAGLGAVFIQGDILSSKFNDEYDIVVNTGLLEHFTPAEREQLLLSFSRSLKNGGIYLTLTPYQGGKIYAWCRDAIMRHGAWPYGPELSVWTLSGLKTDEIVLLDERQVAGLDQLVFIGAAFPLLGLVLSPLTRFLRRAHLLFEPIVLHTLGGYCIADTFVKKGNRATLVQKNVRRRTAVIGR